LSNYNET